MTIVDRGVARPSHRSFNSMNYFLEHVSSIAAGEREFSAAELKLLLSS